MGLATPILTRLSPLVHQSRLLQLGLLTGCWLVGEAVVRTVRLPLPAGVVGMGLVLLLLKSGLVTPASMRRGASWFFDYMMLFFVPAVLVVLEHPEFLSLLGLKILGLIVVSTVLVMAGTALSVEFYFRWRMRHAHD